MDIGIRIKNARKAQGLTQEDVARRAGVTLSLISRIERGLVTDLHFSTMSSLVDALDMSSISELVGEDAYPKAEASPEEGWVSEERRTVGDREETPTLTLEAVRRLLEEQVGTSLLALPEEEWEGWWRGIPQEEAHERRKQIIKEWEFLKPQFVALTEGKPSLLPRRRGKGDVFLKLWMRALIEAPESVPTKANEPEQAFKRRQWEDRRLEWTEVKHPQAENAPDEASGAEAG